MRQIKPWPSFYDIISLQSKTCLFQNIKVCSIYKMAINVKDAMNLNLVSVLFDGWTAEGFYVILYFIFFKKNDSNKPVLLILYFKMKKNSS